MVSTENTPTSFLLNPDSCDSPWEFTVEKFLPEFFEFYFPHAYTKINWNVPYQFLDQELSAVVRDAQLGTRLVDKRVKVTGNDGQNNWLYIHIEIQRANNQQF